MGLGKCRCLVPGDDPQERDRENRWSPSNPTTTTTTAVTVTVAAEHAGRRVLGRGRTTAGARGIRSLSLSR